MVLYIIGLGLGDVEDITVKGLNAVRKCARVYLEHYTSILKSSKEELEAFYGRALLLADREQVESYAHHILKGAEAEDVALLVVGDPFAATTHSDLVVRAHDRGIRVEVVHNASIMSAVAACGLQLYSFGPTISVPFWTDKWRPDSFYDKLKLNRAHGHHTLCLLDIKVKEQSEENLHKCVWGRGESGGGGFAL
jgi:diphthine synthase